MGQIEYLSLNGSGWSLSAKLTGGGKIRPSQASPEQVAKLIQQLLDSDGSSMTFDEHPKFVRRIEIDFARKSIQLVADDMGPNQ